MSVAYIGALGASELIINGKGHIYHIDMAPHHLADTVITVGDPERVQMIARYFDKIEHQGQHREFVSATGYIGKKRLTVVSTGIGPDNIDIVLNELDALCNIDFETRTEKSTRKTLSVFRIGTCGALQEDVPVESMIVSSYGIGLDNLLHYYRYAGNTDEAFILNEFQRHTGLNGKPVWPYIAEGSIALRKHFGKGYLHGITVTCPGFYAPQGRTLRAAAAYPNLVAGFSTFRSRDERILNFEMETSAIYGLGKILGHQCLSINLVINNRAAKTFIRNASEAMDSVIRKSLEIIAGLQ